jgi:hypothetical protein
MVLAKKQRLTTLLQAQLKNQVLHINLNISQFLINPLLSFKIVSHRYEITVSRTQ